MLLFFSLHVAEFIAKLAVAVKALHGFKKQLYKPMEEKSTKRYETQRCGSCIKTVLNCKLLKGKKVSTEEVLLYDFLDCIHFPRCS